MSHVSYSSLLWHWSVSKQHSEAVYTHELHLHQSAVLSTRWLSTSSIGINSVSALMRANQSTGCRLFSFEQKVEVWIFLQQEKILQMSGDEIFTDVWVRDGGTEENLNGSYNIFLSLRVPTMGRFGVNATFVYFGPHWAQSWQTIHHLEALNVLFIAAKQFRIITSMWQLLCCCN